MKVNQIETPALVVNEEIFEENFAAMSKILAGTNLHLRPHYKSHKCAAIAHRQIAAGAVGMTCAKLEEAEDLADSGVEDVLIANEIVDPRKIRRAADLAGRCHLTVCVDNENSAKMLSAAATAAGTTVFVLVEFEIGMQRCGVADEGEYVELAKLVSRLPGLTYAGIQAYAGHVSHMVSEAERQAHTDASGQRIRALISLLEQNGLTVGTVSGGSTGTAVIKAKQGLYTELQAGSYPFLDTTYRALGLPFRNSLFLLTTVLSRQDGLAVLDAGVKSLGVDQDEPVFLDESGREIPVERIEVNEEHTKLFRPGRDLAVGDRVFVIPGHCCSTINLHDRLYFYRGDRVTERVLVTARGKSR